MSEIRFFCDSCKQWIEDEIPVISVPAPNGTLLPVCNSCLDNIALFVSQGKNYRIDKNENGDEYIQCLKCGLISYHPEDIKHCYCNNCKLFHNE